MSKKLKPKKLKSPAPEYPVPQSMTEANSFIERIGKAQRKREYLQTQMNEQMAALKAVFEKKAEPFNEEINACSKGLSVFCAANRMEMTHNGKVKFYRFPAGTINWRCRPPKVSIRGVAMVIERLKALQLTQFLRIREEINKEAMLAEPEIASSLEGVKVGSECEDFVVTPFNTELEEVA